MEQWNELICAFCLETIIEEKSNYEIIFLCIDGDVRLSFARVFQGVLIASENAFATYHHETLTFPCAA